MSRLSDDIAARLENVAGSHLFLDCDGKTLSYGQLGKMSKGLCGVFSDHGLKAGSRIAVLASHPSDVSCLVLAALSAGVAVAVLNPESTQTELQRACKACNLDMILCEKGLADDLSPPAPTTMVTFLGAGDRSQSVGLLGRLRRKKEQSQTLTLQALAHSATPAAPTEQIGEDTVAILLNTSGTTGAPKVVQLTHRNVAAQLDAFETVYDFDDKSRILNPLPMHFTDGLFHGPINTFINGATLYRPVTFELGKLEELLNSVYRDAITHMVVVPAILALMDRLGNAFADSFQSDTFRYIRCSGDHLTPALWTSIEKRFDVRVVNTYGMSETVCEAFYSGPSDDMRKIGTIGKAVGCEWRIVDERNEPVAPDQSGELHLKGEIITPGYYNQPELTAKSFSDGWFRTGDLAAAQADGFVEIVGRQKDLIIAGGVNVQPQEIVDCLFELEGIADATVVGVPHGVWGEQIAAVIVLNEGSDLGRNDILSHCRSNLSPQKVPSILKFMDHLPKNAAGKTVKADVLKEIQAQEMSAGALPEGTVAEQVLIIAGTLFGVPADELHPSTQPDDVLGWDSLAHLNLISQLENAFEVTFSAREVLSVDRLSDLIDIIVKKHA